MDENNWLKLWAAAEELAYQNCLVKGSCGKGMEEICKKWPCHYYNLRSALQDTAHEVMKSSNETLKTKGEIVCGIAAKT